MTTQPSDWAAPYCIVERLAAVKDKFPFGTDERKAVWEAIEYFRRLRARELDASGEAYAKANPLGGPATMFEAIARRLRAGENYDEVLADYGLARAAEAGDLAKVRALADKWDRQAAEHGVRQFTGNDHALFANELRAAMGAVGATSPGTGQTEA